jgi:hypothetical protein
VRTEQVAKVGTAAVKDVELFRFDQFLQRVRWWFEQPDSA